MKTARSQSEVLALLGMLDVALHWQVSCGIAWYYCESLLGIACNVSPWNCIELRWLALLGIARGRCLAVQ
eukprot:9186769-Pyramimonas_sp.AAC.1